MTFQSPRFMAPRRTKETCKFGPGLFDVRQAAWKKHPKKTTGLGFSRGLFKSPNLAGCFPPKPPARFLMHCDHRRDAKNQQEYRGNKREGLDRRGCGDFEHLQKCGKAKRPAQEKTLTA